MANQEKAKEKRPTAAKRDLRNEKLRLINKSFKSNARTTMRVFEEAVKSGDKDKIQVALSSVYSIADKAVKRGIYKPNKAARVKERANQKSAL